MTNSECLAHHGVKGMKWGVRKAETSVHDATTYQGNRRKSLSKEKAKANKKAVSDAYKRELANPGSTKLSTGYLSSKRAKNQGIGYATGTLAATYGIQAAGYVAMALSGYGAPAVGAAAVSAVLGSAAGGVSAHSIRRGMNITESINLRENTK